VTSQRSGVTVVLCTRNRSADCVTALESLAAMKPPADTILVIDQSDDRSVDVIDKWRETTAADVRYVRQDAVGLSRARNLALSESPTDLLVFTDDDCTVPVDFIAKVIDARVNWPNAGLIFGNVRPGPHDAATGLIPCAERSDVVVATAIPDQRHLGAMGACMVLRRDLLPRNTGFDPCLGVGGMFRSAEDTDLILRCLAAGIPVVETPSIEVVHHGFRTWAEAAVLADHYLFGTAAVYAKHARLHPLPTLSLLSHVGARWVRGESRVSYFGTRTSRPERLASFLRGFARGMRWPIDQSTGHFES
jgi:GT2 family glycosyltransferase